MLSFLRIVSYSWELRVWRLRQMHQSLDERCTRRNLLIFVALFLRPFFLSRAYICHRSNNNNALYLEREREEKTFCWSIHKLKMTIRHQQQLVNWYRWFRDIYNHHQQYYFYGDYYYYSVIYYFIFIFIFMH